MSWAVVGAGVLGLRVADELAARGHEVTVYEAAPTLGGLAATWEIGDVRWDRHYHVTLLSDRRTMAMYESVGLENEIVWSQTRTGYYGPDRLLRSVSSPLEFLKLPTLSAVDKVRLGLTLAYGSVIPSGQRMERIGVDQWLRRWSGRSAFDSFWRPLLRAKLGDAYPRASAAFIWSTIRRLSAARRNGLNEERFGYVRGGYGRVFDAFEKKLTACGVTIKTESPVTSVVPTKDGLEVSTEHGTHRYDRVVITTSSRLAADMCPALLPAERERLERVEYIGIVCVSLVLLEPLADYYLTYITDPSTPFTAVVEMTALVDPSELAGHALVYLPKYVDRDDPVLTMSDEQIIETFLGHLDGMYADFRREHVVAARVSRIRDVFAVPTLGYSERAPSIGTSIPGLYTVGSANLPFSTLNVDDTLSLVADLLSAVGQRSSHEAAPPLELPHDVQQRKAVLP